MYPQSAVAIIRKYELQFGNRHGQSESKVNVKTWKPRGISVRLDPETFEMVYAKEKENA